MKVPETVRVTYAMRTRLEAMIEAIAGEVDVRGIAVPQGTQVSELIVLALNGLQEWKAEDIVRGLVDGRIGT